MKKYPDIERHLASKYISEKSTTQKST